MKRLITAIFFLLSLTVSANISADGGGWIGTWAAAEEYTGKGDMPAISLSGTTVRQIIQVSCGGSRVRLSLSNRYGSGDTEIRSVYIAPALDSCLIDAARSRYLTFKGRRSVTILPGERVVSDALDFNLNPLQRVSVTIVYGKRVPEHATSHRGSRTTSYIAVGNVKPGHAFRTVERVDHWYNIARLEVEGEAPVVAVLGNSITDGRGTTTNAQNRWTDIMARRMNAESPFGVLNLGIGGNCVISGGISEPALKRYHNDILTQNGVRHLIIYEGTNDIGLSDGDPVALADSLIAAYQTIIAASHAAGLKVLMATITPTKGNGWYSEQHEVARQRVNAWIRQSSGFEGVVDFDALVRDPSEPDRLRSEYSEDWLHLNPKGYKAMGEYAAGILLNQKTNK